MISPECLSKAALIRVPKLKKSLGPRANFTKANAPMKKLLSFVAMLAVVGLVLLTGCKQEEAAPTVPAVPSTNAPAAK